MIKIYLILLIIKKLEASETNQLSHTGYFTEQTDELIVIIGICINVILSTLGVLGAYYSKIFYCFLEEKIEITESEQFNLLMSNQNKLRKSLPGLNLELNKVRSEICKLDFFINNSEKKHNDHKKELVNTLNNNHLDDFSKISKKSDNQANAFKDKINQFQNDISNLDENNNILDNQILRIKKEIEKLKSIIKDDQKENSNLLIELNKEINFRLSENENLRKFLNDKDEKINIYMTNIKKQAQKYDNEALSSKKLENELKPRTNDLIKNDINEQIQKYKKRREKALIEETLIHGTSQENYKPDNSKYPDPINDENLKASASDIKINDIHKILLKYKQNRDKLIQEEALFYSIYKENYMSDKSKYPDPLNPKYSIGSVSYYQSDMKSLYITSGKDSWLNDVICEAYLECFNKEKKALILPSVTIQKILFNSAENNFNGLDVSIINYYNIENKINIF